MTIDELPSYDDTLKTLRAKKRKIHLLLGNGFSIAYDSNIFSYNALNTFINDLEDEVLKKLFSIIKTKDFETVMQQLDNFCEIADAFGSDKTLVSKIQNASESLKTNLIEAVNKLHPEHVFEIPDYKQSACIKFLREYIDNDGEIFTTNYDLLLYWVLMRGGSENAIDGFGRDRGNEADEYVEESELEYSELRWGKHRENQNIHYLHGALQIFDAGTEIVKEEYDTQHYLLDKIQARLKEKEYPIFITAGNGKEKLTHINHNKYLSFCFEKLCSIKGSLIVFGFGFSEYDDHIIKAINIAAKMGKRVGNKLFSIYIGVFSEKSLKHIQSIKDQFKCKVNLFDARSVNVWS
jgi:hypothetical protein